jgi:hypothetical protein
MNLFKKIEQRSYSSLKTPFGTMKGSVLGFISKRMDSLSLLKLSIGWDTLKLKLWFLIFEA